jgi:hypothetical protein
VLEILAGRDCQPQARNRRLRRRHGPGAADAAAMAERGKAIPVAAVGRKAADLDVHAVRAGGYSVDPAALDDAAHRFVGGDFPADRDTGIAHAAVGRLRLRCEPRPQHEAVGAGVTRGDAERERIRPGFRCRTFQRRSAAGAEHPAESARGSPQQLAS